MTIVQFVFTSAEPFQTVWVQERSLKTEKSLFMCAAFRYMHGTKACMHYKPLFIFFMQGLRYIRILNATFKNFSANLILCEGGQKVFKLTQISPPIKEVRVGRLERKGYYMQQLSHKYLMLLLNKHWRTPCGCPACTILFGLFQSGSNISKVKIFHEPSYSLLHRLNTNDCRRTLINRIIRLSSKRRQTEWLTTLQNKLLQAQLFNC